MLYIKTLIIHVKSNNFDVCKLILFIPFKLTLAMKPNMVCILLISFLPISVSQKETSQLFQDASTPPIIENLVIY